MKTCFYCCSYKIFQQLDIDGELLNLYNHKGLKKESSIYLFPKESSSTTINPENFFNIKKEIQLSDIMVIDRIYSKDDVVYVDDHINRTGLSYLRGKTPFKNLPTFPDISNIYKKKNGKILMSVGNKNSFNINLEKNVILSSWIAAISPVWHYVGVNVIGLGISKNLKHVKKITKFLK